MGFSLSPTSKCYNYQINTPISKFQSWLKWRNHCVCQRFFLFTWFSWIIFTFISSWNAQVVIVRFWWMLCVVRELQTTTIWRKSRVNYDQSQVRQSEIATELPIESKEREICNSMVANSQYHTCTVFHHWCEHWSVSFIPMWKCRLSSCDSSKRKYK